MASRLQAAMNATLAAITADVRAHGGGESLMKAINGLGDMLVASTMATFDRIKALEGRVTALDVRLTKAEARLKGKRD